MKPLVLYYAKCSTCKKALKWLDDHGVDYDGRAIVEDHPSSDELGAWISASGLPIKRFFNTSGMKYRELGLKDKLATMSEDEQIALLATDGMLVKRPLLVSDAVIWPGFKEAEWQKLLS
ncbi:MAG: arsenate reductase family protein [Peptococcaceae bacterium]|nr:arsenate reductase family protein [Peptococcaceae bacterium]